jgi:hypothetical protein
MAHVRNLGMVRDMQDRVALARVDDHDRQSSVTAARKLIYNENYGVSSAAVERLLKGTSLLPNTVRMQVISCF